MRIASLLQASAVALTLTAGLVSVAPAFAASSDQTQAQQQSNTGPYDGAWFEASKQSLGVN
jgi:hypothetical protein